LVHVIDGEAEVTLAAETFRLKTGEVMIMPAKNPMH
jgi:quercetin dioxygenase-like cupin family protein